MYRLVLFDIDCTLIDAHGAGGRAIFRAIEDVYGVTGDLDGYTFHGRTDPGIILDLAIRWGTPEAVARDRLQACLDRYPDILAAEIGDGEVEVLPGAHELVTALAVDRRVTLGLLTGNIDRGMELKLASSGLLPLFKVVANGSDSGYRPDLPAIAVERAARLTGHLFAGKEIVIIGDTPADILCGAGQSVRTIAVATGRHNVDELAEHDPDYLFADLGDWRTVMHAILEERGTEP